MSTTISKAISNIPKLSASTGLTTIPATYCIRHITRLKIDNDILAASVLPQTTTAIATQQPTKMTTSFNIMLNCP